MQRINGSLTLLCLSAIIVTSGVSSLTQAQTFGVNAREAPSVINYGFRGLATGSLLGVSAGYLAIRGTENNDDDLAIFLTATGVGALTGAGLGLALGFVDLQSENPGVGGIVLRDTLYGTLLGGAAGLIVGGIVALNGGEAEDLAFGSSVGALSGAGVGIIFGLIEGPRIVNSYNHRYQSSRTWDLNLTAVQDRSKNLVWMPSFTGRF